MKKLFPNTTKQILIKPPPPRHRNNIKYPAGRVSQRRTSRCAPFLINILPLRSGNLVDQMSGRFMWSPRIQTGPRFASPRGKIFHAATATTTTTTTSSTALDGIPGLPTRKKKYITLTHFADAFLYVNRRDSLKSPGCGLNLWKGWRELTTQRP